MAKGKRSTALFDVMHAARKPASDPPGGFAIPKWWGKRATKTVPTAPANPPPPPTADSPAIVSPIIEEPNQLPEIQPTMRIVSETPTADEPVLVDPIEREVRFKLSYGGAAAAACVLILILVIAYLIGTRSQPVETGKLIPPVGDNTHTDASGLLAAVTPAPIAPAPAPVTDVPVSPVAPSALPVAPPAATDSAGRQIGKHYVIAQSYPDKDIAIKACDVLNKAGIPCTVIKGLPGWASDSWYSVVGTKAFDHIQSNDDLMKYENAMQSAGAQFAGKSAFNRFDPKEYKWRALADQADVVQ